MNDSVSDRQSWQEYNARHLATAMARLRVRLEKLAQGQATPVKPQPTQKSPVATVPAPLAFRSTDLAAAPAGIGASLARLFSWSFDTAATPSVITTVFVTEDVTDSPDEPTNDEEMVEFPPALEQLSRRFGLSPFEANVLLLCVAMELDTRIAGLCAQAQGDPQRTYPTFALALALFDEPAWEALVPERPLRYWRLLEINQPGATPLTASSLRADERIVHYIKGANYLDDRLTPLLSPLYLQSEPNGALPALPESQQQAVDAIVRYWSQAPAHSPLPVAQLLGPDAASKHLVAQQATAALGRQLCRLSVEMLPTNQSELEALARLWQRECLLLPLALYLDAQEVESSEPQMATVQRFLARSDGLFMLGVRQALPHFGRTTFAVEIARPTPLEQQAAWVSALGKEHGHEAKLLAGQFSLNLAEIGRLASLAADNDASTAVAESTLWALCRDHDRPRLDALAQRLEPKATWDDLVLPDAETALLQQIVAQVRQRGTIYDEWGFRAKMNRGMGISALFAGSSGTGKTMAAEVIANDLRLNLYRIDLSAVVSKYIGETEKNLRRLFDAAEGGSTILFFDEADALFGKRSEVKDSHDRYANIEINYLLQRMEGYSGLAILATNMKSALDPAFVRRLRFIINFPFPGVAERKRMWQKVFPLPLQQKHLDRAGLDFDKLARLTLTGGNIHNVALSAAFAAAHAGQPVTMQTVLQGARLELRKLEVPINEADFR